MEIPSTVEDLKDAVFPDVFIVDCVKVYKKRQELYLHDKLFINNDGLHPVVEIDKPITLKAGLHPISVK